SGPTPPTTTQATPADAAACSDANGPHEQEPGNPSRSASDPRPQHTAQAYEPHLSPHRTPLRCSNDTPAAHAAPPAGHPPTHPTNQAPPPSNASHHQDCGLYHHHKPHWLHTHATHEDQQEGQHETRTSTSSTNTAWFG